MKHRALAGAALAAMTLVAACAPRPAPPPVVAPPPAPPPPAPPPANAPPPPAADWRDGPVAQGDWSYTNASGIPEAVFASPGGPLFALRCEPDGQIVLFRMGMPAGAMTIVTTFGERRLATFGNEDQANVRLSATDPLFDQIAFSRGRFLVRVEGGGSLVIPSWAEPQRVIEDCRRH
jgi:hypothetical protein